MFPKQLFVVDEDGLFVGSKKIEDVDEPEDGSKSCSVAIYELKEVKKISFERILK